MVCLKSFQIYMKSFEEQDYISGKSRKKSSPKGSNSRTNISPVPDRQVNGHHALGDRLVR